VVAVVVAAVAAAAVVVVAKRVDVWEVRGRSQRQPPLGGQVRLTSWTPKCARWRKSSMCITRSELVRESESASKDALQNTTVLKRMRARVHFFRVHCADFEKFITVHVEKSTTRASNEKLLAR
jgi:hypothetical protein